MKGILRQSWILDSTSWIPDYRHWIQHSLTVELELYSEFESPGFWIPQEKFVAF